MDANRERENGAGAGGSPPQAAGTGGGPPEAAGTGGGQGVAGGATPEAVVIKVRKNGPYKVTGPVTVIDADGNEYELPEGDGIVLCRCGGSATKPFCDGTHKRNGFEAPSEAGAEPAASRGSEVG
jgi:CDGSH iron-sulfur domain-containing protein 3